MGRIKAIVPASRCMTSDFKCSAPGGDEAALLIELAELAGLRVACSVWELPTSGVVVLYARSGRRKTALTVPREKYAFPPTAMLAYLNELLKEQDAERRLVACDDGPPWEAGNDGSSVVLVDDDERDRLLAIGVTLR